MPSKKLLIPVVAVIVGGSALLGVSAVANAQAGNSPFFGLAQEIASKFNLNSSDVQNTISTYMQQQHANMMQNRQQFLKNKLDQEVSAGKITSDQETAILNELTTLKNKYNIGPGNFKSMTQTQRQQAMQNMQNDLKSWTQSNGINLSLIPGFGMGMHRGWRFGNHPTATPTP